MGNAGVTRHMGATSPLEKRAMEAGRDISQLPGGTELQKESIVACGEAAEHLLGAYAVLWSAYDRQRGQGALTPAQKAAFAFVDRMDFSTARDNVTHGFPLLLRREAEDVPPHLARDYAHMRLVLGSGVPALLTGSQEFGLAMTVQELEQLLRANSIDMMLHPLVSQASSFDYLLAFGMAKPTMPPEDGYPGKVSPHAAFAAHERAAREVSALKKLAQLRGGHADVLNGRVIGVYLPEGRGHAPYNGHRQLAARHPV